jgi:hypothetical protein
MFDNGWVPVPCEAKERMLEGWTSMTVDREAIEGWDRRGSPHPNLKGTGIRLEGDVFVIDIDVDIPEVYDAIVERLYARWPDFFAEGGALERTSGGVKTAFFGRVSKPFKQSRTHGYTADAELLAQLQQAMTPESRKAIKKTLNGQKVEVFGGASNGRYFAWDGPHKKPGRFYAPVGERAPWNTRLDALPVFEHDEIHELVEMCEAVLAEHLTAIPLSAPKAGGVFYDLVPGMTFISKEGNEETLEELEARLETGVESGQRGLMDWESWSMSDSKAHCNAFIGPRGRLIIQDFMDDRQYRWEDDKPPAPVELSEATKAVLREERAKADAAQAADPEPPGGTPPPPSARDGTFQEALDWMIANFVHCKGDLVMPKYDVDPLSGMSVNEFHHRYQKYSQQRVGARPGVLSYATRVWLGHADMVAIDGYDMRPDMDWPLFYEGGKTFKNTYKPPNHKGDGDIEPWHRFMAHLLPKPAERERYQDTLAKKRQASAIPGPAIVMVAESEENLGDEQSGTGRGTLFKILIRLFGWRYAKIIDFEIFAGISNQATYTDWQADLVMAFIEESKESSNSGFIGGRSVYEHSKSMIDIDARRATVRAKYGKPREAMLNCTYLIASNHGNAFRIPASDRRYLILSNGEKMSEAMAMEMDSWMKQPGNIAALDRFLMARDVSHYNPMAVPMVTEARERMVEQSLGEVDRAVRETLNGMGGKAFTRAQVLTGTRILVEDPDLLRSTSGQVQFGQAFKRMTVGLSLPGIRPKKERRVRVGGEGQVRAYVRSREHERECDAMDSDTLQGEITKSSVREVSKEGRQDHDEKLAEAMKNLPHRSPSKPPSGE